MNTIVGEGTNLYFLSVQFLNGHYYNFTLRSSAPSLLGEDLLNTVAEDAEFLVLQQDNPGGEGNHPFAIAISDDSSLYDPAAYWLYWKADNGQSPAWEMTYSLESVQTVFPGQANAWVEQTPAQGQNYVLPEATSFIVPEPNAATFILVGVIALLCRQAKVCFRQKQRLLSCALLPLLSLVSLVAKVRGQLQVSVAPSTTPFFLEVSSTGAAVTALRVTTAPAVVTGFNLDKIVNADPDLVVAAAAYAMLDPRYPDIAPESYYGARLEAVKQRIATEGLTPANKAELLAVYQGAAAALQAFLAISSH